jgi:hypothetical protein
LARYGGREVDLRGLDRLFVGEERRDVAEQATVAAAPWVIASPTVHVATLDSARSRPLSVRTA